MAVIDRVCISPVNAFQCFQVCNPPVLNQTAALTNPTAIQPLAHANEARFKPRDLLDAGLLFLLGMFTHQLPVRSRPGKAWLPTDWKAFFRIATGIVAVNRLNSGLNWQPPPWLGALEAVSVINPLALGLNSKSIRQYLVMAPLVVATVQTASTLHEKVAQPLRNHYHIPRLMTRLAISTGFAALGIKLYPKLFQSVAKTGILGRTMKKQAAEGLSVLGGSSFMTCARGCSPGSIICLSETAELMGGLTNWLKTRVGNTTDTSTTPNQKDLS